MKFLVLVVILASILLFLRFKKKKQDKFTNNKVNNDSVIDLEKDPRTKEYKPKRLRVI